MNQPMTFAQFMASEIAALRSDHMQVGDSYVDPPLAKKDPIKNKALIEEIEVSLKVSR